MPYKSIKLTPQVRVGVEYMLKRTEQSKSPDVIAAREWIEAQLKRIERKKANRAQIQAGTDTAATVAAKARFASDVMAQALRTLNSAATAAPGYDYPDATGAMEKSYGDGS